uniref:ShKT domain-containing protein n=1 Tax=Strongyloides venezuelensis TaxID=75913 RepID=A0A0K0FME6_STRVS
MLSIHILITFLLFIVFSSIVSTNVTIESSTSLITTTTKSSASLTTSTNENIKNTSNNISTDTTKYETTTQREENNFNSTTNSKDCYDKTFKNGITCSSLKDFCSNSEYKKIMEEKCRKTCGIC